MIVIAVCCVALLEIESRRVINMQLQRYSRECVLYICVSYVTVHLLSVYSGYVIME